jgi:hypothetical protein
MQTSRVIAVGTLHCSTLSHTLLLAFVTNSTNVIIPKLEQGAFERSDSKTRACATADLPLEFYEEDLRGQITAAAVRCRHSLQ